MLDNQFDTCASKVPVIIMSPLKCIYNTRMHSSRMRTARSSSRPGGSPPGTPDIKKT